LEEISEKGEETASPRKDAKPEVSTEGMIFFWNIFSIISICFLSFLDTICIDGISLEEVLNERR
jgi:hypothetical protein